jgi:hypothetical protein
VKVGDLVTLSARGWKLEYPQRWLKRRHSNYGDNRIENRIEARSSYVGLVIRAAPTGTILVKWLTDEGPTGPWAYWGADNGFSLWNRGHLKFVSKGKRA